jgi:hypothetical protein
MRKAGTTDISRILELSAKTSENTKLIHDTLREKGLSSPSFQPDAAIEMPPELINARDTLLDATSELHDLFSSMELLFPPWSGEIVSSPALYLV